MSFRSKLLPNLLPESTGVVLREEIYATSGGREAQTIEAPTERDRARGSVGTIQVIISSESAVGDLITRCGEAVHQGRRRPTLLTANPSSYGLHYSQFSLESLDGEEKLIALGSRNFFLCPRKPPPDGSAATMPSSSASGSGEAEKCAKRGFRWLKFMDFLK